MRWLVALLAAAACGGSGFDYEGMPGQPQAVSFPGLIPTGPVSVDGAAAKDMGFDTGSPITFCDASAYPSRTIGVGDADLGLLGLTFPGYQTLTIAAFSEDSDSLSGLVGGELMRHFGFSLDYKGRRAWLSDPFDPAAAPSDLGVEAEAQVAFQLAGGGVYRAGSDSVTVPETRVLFRVQFEGRSPVWALLDTGATSIVLREDLYASLGGSSRPRLDGIQVETVNGTLDAFQTRVWRADVDGVVLDDVPALVISGSPFFGGVSQETGRDVQALVGGHFLRAFFTTVDYQASQVRLARYADPTHIDPNEWIGPGFRMRLMGNDWTIHTVFPGTDAATRGLAVGDVVELIGTMAIRGLDAGAVNNLLDAYGLGTQIPLEISRGAGTIDVQVLVQDLLPHYPPPS
jgi:hypothetical protein